MSILVMRPFPDNETTAAALRSAGHSVLLSPALRFEPVPFRDEPDESDARPYDAIVATSANALRGIEGQPVLERLRGTKLFAVGNATAQMARSAGFRDVESAAGDAVALIALVEKRLRGKGRICYLAGADVSRDLGADLGARGYRMTTLTTYRMIPLPHFSEAVEAAFAAGEVEAVLHYSRRSARTFVGAVQAAGLEISALALPQFCISDVVGAVLRDAGAARVYVAASPDEPAMFEALYRAVARKQPSRRKAKSDRI
jgi:uroporphyrinogen-III synthase